MNTDSTDEDLRMVPLRRGAAMIGVSPRTIQRIAKSGALPTVRTGGKSGARWVTVNALRRFVAGGGVPMNTVPEIYC